MDIKRTSKRLSLILRHRPDSVGITLTPDGWVAVPTLLEALARHGLTLTRDQLGRVVDENDKKRFTIEGAPGGGERIRANQGHSIDVELGYEAQGPPETLYHGTADRNLPAIREQGLVKGRRHHVHLSPDPATARTVGTRHGRPVVLTVAAARMARDGHTFFRSANGVWLTDAVPPRYLSEPRT
ncbi:RNA 2'-phosphotransferase [Catenuloplanes atrovinosus]|uniref:Probable RNA 2'-phosphotransferase n=1 Tax=Catenuloplanes atrovinosus TaxID=137266 RepID=A0AAE4CAQ5_9ACTN|nr:RNA 2'-phosphotransferase [Catenuloplanes atrovinosus]MDR7276059.1 putative RNA 2'-phosphotransferase [Catenuloplanes atrovinosus]